MSMIELWRHFYGEQRGILSLSSGMRLEPGSKVLESFKTACFDWSTEREQARAWIEREAAAGRETYHCAHLLSARRRVKENAAPITALWVDDDDAKARRDLPEPTAVVESSAGRKHLYYRLTRAVAPEIAEKINRRLAVAIGADKSGYDLTQLLRPPGMPNFKYVGAPLVYLLKLKAERHDPAELDQLLPSLAQEGGIKGAKSSRRPEDLGAAPELSRLSWRVQDLIHYGNRGGYKSRSEADMAACVAMFRAGYSDAEVWAAMIDPANGISDKYIEKGRQGEQYLSLTIGKAQALVGASPRLRSQGKVYARRKGAISVG
ncbi:MAG: hypothetical protein JOZ19_05300 [Rubrobacter sp.]|nr:hypothetical protein [Rubrobacter sp.]